MSIIAYFWCLWGLCLSVRVNLTSGFSSRDTNGEIRFILPLAGCSAFLPAWRSQAGLSRTKCGARFQNLCHPGRNRAPINIIMGERTGNCPLLKEAFTDQKSNSVIYFVNNNINLFYAYCANFL